MEGAPAIHSRSSMNPFPGENFLLQNPAGQQLYHEHAAHLPVIDYHSHLSVRRIAENIPFENITEAWLADDHYKWRAMRASGVPEEYITGKATDREKFFSWAACVPNTLRNPLYHWTHLELKRLFGINSLLNPGSAQEIFNRCNGLLGEQGMTPRGILQQMKVETICTTDDPADDLSWHGKIKKDGFSVQVLPGFRPDKILDASDPLQYNAYLDRLSAAAGMEVATYPDLLEALSRRVIFFSDRGCRLSDHGMQQMPAPHPQGRHAETVFRDIRQGRNVTVADQVTLQFEVLKELCLLYHAQGWTQQFHLGALRNCNTRIRKNMGSDAGTDSIGDFPQAATLASFLDGLDASDRLAKTILYNLNSSDNGVFATMAGNFNDGSMAGKIQWGPAWWFLDQKEGIEAQLNTLSAYGLLAKFTGMVTDSRSFLSFPRHEYFRRILCNLIGRDMEQGELPDDMQMLGALCTAVCYHNAKNYFRF
jgi:glucuronate isomerase